jgi:hypothetical protein
MSTFKKYLLKCFFINLSVLILSVPLIWLQIYHPQIIYSSGKIVRQYSGIFIAFRFLFIMGLYVGWPKAIARIAKKKGWSIEKRQFWLSQRLRVTVWLIIFELLVCENLLGYVITNTA